MLVYAYRVVVFVLQVPPVDGTLGCGVWRLWCCWNVQYLSLKLKDNSYDCCQYKHKLVRYYFIFTYTLSLLNRKFFPPTTLC